MIIDENPNDEPQQRCHICREWLPLDKFSVSRHGTRALNCKVCLQKKYKYNCLLKNKGIPKPTETMGKLTVAHSTSLLYRRGEKISRYEIESSRNRLDDTWKDLDGYIFRDNDEQYYTLDADGYLVACEVTVTSAAQCTHRSTARGQDQVCHSRIMSARTPKS